MSLDVMESYLELVESGRTFDSPRSVLSARQSLSDLVQVASDDGELALDGAWRLDSEAVRELEERTGYAPAGGWREFAALAAGTDALRATREVFEPAVGAGELAERNEAELTRQLMEAFTVRLVPPTTAAGLFILLRLHPAWGVHLAHRAHCDGDEGDELPSSGSEPGHLFPETSRRMASETVFGAIAAMVATLRELDANRAYDVDALAGFVETLCGSVRRSAGDDSSEEAGGLEVFVGGVDAEIGSSNWRVRDFVTSDLIDSFLVPAGAARRFDDGTFCVIEGAFEGVRVGEYDPADQLESLVDRLGDDDQCRVA